MAGSQTATITTLPPPLTVVEAEVLNLYLTPAPTVTWEETVINNEGLGRKSSKRCCIFKKKKAWDESDTESEDEGDGDDESDDDAGPGAALKAKLKKEAARRFHA